MQWLEKCVSIPAALLAAQFPQFFQQYLHELSGHVAELNFQASILQKSAEIAQKPLPALIHKFLHSGDPDIRQQGHVMQGVVERLQDFSQAFQHLQQATIVSKPFLFIRYADLSILGDTWSRFSPGISFSVESMVYLVIGLIIGHLTFLGGRALFNALRSRFRLEPLQDTSHSQRR